ncbi:protein phosphatase 2C domain-containing protein [Patescibacteria group bacterium]|nr:protein phosphatase 2C domain-containing protein [Patescibacteria group bacterium]
MKIRYYTSSLSSPTHPNENQDSFFVNEKTKVAGVLDGVGGIAHGAEAAAWCAEYFKNNLSGENIEEAFEHCHELLKKKSRNKFGKDIATTSTVVQIYPTQISALVAWGNVGDSRLYHLSTNRLIQKSIDDSLITQAQERGWVSHEKAERINQAADLKGFNEIEQNLFRSRNIILQAMGIGEMKPRIGKFMAKKGDAIVITSDGIHDNLTNAQIKQILKVKPTDPAKKLVEEATFISESDSIRAKSDDMTAVVVELF